MKITSDKQKCFTICSLKEEGVVRRGAKRRKRQKCAALRPRFRTGIEVSLTGMQLYSTTNLAKSGRSVRTILFARQPVLDLPTEPAAIIPQKQQLYDKAAHAPLPAPEHANSFPLPPLQSTSAKPRLRKPSNAQLLF
jgi:hypothetical protein